jgi:hypothetical protein
MSNLVTIIVALVIGIVLAVGATFGTSAVLHSPPTPSNQPAYSYGN